MPKLYQMTEDRVAGQVGISRERIREIRMTSLVMGLHFEKNGAAIVYTDSGIDAVLHAISTNIQKTLESISEKTAPPSVLSESVQTTPTINLETLKIVKIFPNPTWVKARSESGAVVQCRVRRNVSMRPGTIIAKCERLSDGTYICRGRF